MKTKKPTPKSRYLYNPYLDFSIEIQKPMSKFKMYFGKILLGFEYREEI